MRAAFLATAHDLKIDIAFQRESIFRRNRRLFAFDMDSTLIEGEVIDELAKLAGVSDKVVRITESAMRGEIEFQESFRRRVALLRGLEETRVQELLDTIPLVEGAEQLIGTLKMLGYKTAILSGGFNFFAQHLQKRLGIDYVYANDLDIADGVVSGQVQDADCGWCAQGRVVPADCRTGKYLARTGGCGGGWRERSADAGRRRHGHSFRAKPMVRQTAGHAVSFLRIG